MEKFIVSYSCGKDSTLALYRMIQQGYVPVGLVVTINKETQMSWFHLVPKVVIQKIADALNIPVYFIESTGAQNYLETYESALRLIKQEHDVSICVFGDIDIEDHRKWCTERTNNVNMKAYFPLWQEDRENLVCEFIEAGFIAMVKVVDTTYLSSEFLGKILTKELITAIKNNGADPCGENGEYHTITIGGPIFTDQIEIVQREITSYEKYNILEIDINK